MPRQSIGGVFVAIALSLGVGACSSAPLDPELDASSTGTVALPLTAQSGDVTYRLVDAKFTIRTGNTSRVIQPLPDVHIHQETLPAGKYEITLEKGWILQAKAGGETSYVAVPAELNTRNPQRFEVKRGVTVDVVFGFATNAGSVVELGRGRANVRIDVQDCKAFDSYAATIATSTVDCLGTIDPSAFVIDDEGFVHRNFSECIEDKSLIQDIDDFLGLQYPREVDGAIGNPLAFSKDCIAGRYAKWRESFDEAGIVACPTWRKAEEINTPTLENYAAFGRLLPGLPFAENGTRPSDVLDLLQINAVYVVSFPNGMPDQACKTPGECAAACAGGFPGFVLRTDGEVVWTDPPTWQRATVYQDPKTNPYVSPGYYHPMSLFGEIPGAIFAHVNRTVAVDPPEYCSYYSDGFHLQTPLRKNCTPMPDGTTSCVGICAP